MRVLGEFSGIGGLELGLQRAGMRIVAVCELDPFCRAVLQEHFPEAGQTEDVQTRRHSPGEADILAAGFPCQDISRAGFGARLEGARSGLWREVVRTLRVVRPQYGLLENVADLLGRGMGKILGDLAEIGYDAEWHCIPACAVGLPHLRDRIWIVAHDRSQREQGQRTPSLCGLYSIPWGENERRAQEWRNRSDLHGPFLRRSSHGISERLDAVGNSATPLISEIIGRELMQQVTSSERIP